MIDDQPIGADLSRNLGNPVAPGEAVEADNEPVRPAGWDDPTPGNPYHPDVIAQRQANHEREVRENRERDRALVEQLNSPED